MTEPYFIIVVDNNSTDGTKEYLQNILNRGKIDEVIFNDENYYPGKATNIGWTEGLKNYDATHLMRLDNDMELREGWYDSAIGYFKAIPELGQLGLDNEAIEDPRAALRALEVNGKTVNPWPGCVGGPCIVKRKIWDEGVRWPESRWDDGEKSKLQEDSRFSRLIMDRGYYVGHMTDNLARTFANESNWSDYPSYYKKTMSERGYDDRLEKAGL
jgi:glycosyltransferase involved in cell wall biosynthesis